MASRLKIALIQMAVVSNKKLNLERTATKVKEAASQGAQLVCLPECFNSPYGTQYFEEYSEEVPAGGSSSTLSNLAKEFKIWLIGGSIPERGSDGRLYNTSVTYNPTGEIVGKYSKTHLFDIDIPGKITFKESSILTAGNSLFSFNIDKWKIGIGICYDIRFPELAQIYANSRGCHLLVYPGAFNMTTGPVHWEPLTRARALDNQLYVAVCSPARDTEAKYVAWGHSMVISPWGDAVATTQEKEDTIFADLDLNEVERVRTNVPIGQQRRFDLYKLAEETK